MIPLRARVNVDKARQPFVVRLNARKYQNLTSHDAVLAEEESGTAKYDWDDGRIEIADLPVAESDRDVLFVVPRQQIAHRLIRSDSPHNTLLITEQCDQRCVMCSQPPKETHTDLFEYLETAALLAPTNCVLGLSGGEPTLYKDQLFQLLHNVLAARPDLTFHILTNGQHFTDQDISAVRALPKHSVIWGVPIYSSNPETHDQIVGKPDALGKLFDGLSLLCRAGAGIELRTVVMRPNIRELPQLALFVATQLPFISRWAIMQLENIGFARKNWDALFVDTSAFFAEVGAAIDIAKAHGLSASLYNFPLCTVPSAYRDCTLPTISDWKQKFLDECTGCSSSDVCGGFFAWYPDDRGFRGVHRL